MARKDVTDRMVVDAYVWRQEFALSPLAVLIETTGESEKVCWRAMERAADRGYIDYGVSLNSGWVTKKGLALINEKPGDDDGDA
jgi:hypothetical protein